MFSIHKTVKKMSFVLFFAFAACSEVDIYHNLAERDANEMLVVLYEQGIQAKIEHIEQAQDVSYTVKVPKKDVFKARQVLQDHNLPKPRQLGLAELCGKDSLVPSAEEERCKKTLGLQGDITRSLEQLPGIVEAHVIINLPSINPLSTETQGDIRPSASVLIHARSGETGLTVSEAKIQRHVANAVEGLDPRDVSVIISLIEIMPKDLGGANPQLNGQNKVEGLSIVAGLSMTPDSKNRFKVYAATMLILLIAVSIGLVINVLKMIKLRQELKVAKLNQGLTQLVAPQSSGQQTMVDAGNNSENSENAETL